MKVTIIYPRGKKPEKKKRKPGISKLKGADAGKTKIIMEEGKEDGRNN